MAIDYVDAGQAIDNSSLAGITGSAPPVAQGVTYERILDARSEPQNWLTYYGAYDGQRYSPLDQITKENVKQLTPAWIFQAGSVGLHSGKSTYSFEAAPLVVDGVMYVSGWDGWVWALDARNGDILWQYRTASPFDVSLCCGNVNRGVAVADGRVFVTTLAAHLIALDAETGKKVWDTTYGDVRAGESATVAPLIVKDMVIAGSSGGEFGNRGHLEAFNRETGERVWRTYMVPKPGEPGSETWPDDGEAWQRGGGNCWVTPTYDPELNLIYQGTGNPCPDFDGAVREGDNLYTDSGVAVDADTGEIKAHFQYTPHDLWDYDSTMEHILFDLAPFVDRIDWGEVDEKGNVTPKVYPDKEGDPVHFWPGPAGAKEWTHACYNPQTELLYAPVQDVGATATRRRREFKESIPYWGAGVAVDLDDMAGSISAFDPRTGEERWRWANDIPMCASLLTTGGGLVFGGEPTGEFNALDAESGDLLWQFQCGSGHHSSPSSYSVDGRQYIAVPTGWGAWTEGFLPGMLGARQGSALVAFALPE
jgi:alcohol dehydrogenase (cytochrome c)